MSVFSAGHVQPNGWGDLIRDNLWYSHTSWAHGFELVLLVAGIFVLVDTTHDRARKLMVIGLFLLSFARFVLPVWGPPLEKLGGFGYYPNLRMFFGGWVFPAVALFHARCHGQILGKL